MRSDFKIYFDNVLINDKIDGLSDFVITYTEDEGSHGVNNIGLSSTLTFYGDGYEFIKRELIDVGLGGLRFINVTIETNCCGLIYDQFIIRGDNIDWCENDCSVTATLRQYDEDSEIFRCLKGNMVIQPPVYSTELTDDEMTFNRDWWNTHKLFVSYCSEIRPSWLHSVAILLVWTMELAYTLLSLIFYAVAGLTSLLTGSSNGLDTLNGIVDDMSSLVTGCGKHFTAFKVKDIIERGLYDCGCAFSSSIFEGDYADLIFISNQIDETLSKYNSDWERSPDYTTYEFLNLIASVFNANWIIKGGVCYFERWDELDLGSTTIDVEAFKRDGRIVDDIICYRWSGDAKPAFFKGSYEDDMYDSTGLEALNDYSIVQEWNNPANDIQEDYKEVNIPFGITRFINDRYDDSVITQYQNFPLIRRVIQDNLLSMKIAQNGLGLDRLFLAKNSGNYKDVAPHYDPISGARVDKIYYWVGKDEVIEGNDQINYGMQFNPRSDFNNSSLYDSDTADADLYQRFWSSENPRLSNKRGLIVNFQFRYTCNDIQTLDLENKIIVLIGTTYYYARIKKVEVNPSTGLINIEGEI